MIALEFPSWERDAEIAISFFFTSKKFRIS